MLTNGRSIQDFKGENNRYPNQTSHPALNQASAALSDYDYDFFSQSLSDGATWGIFEWLRSTGYPRSERPIYQHSWIDLEGTDEEEVPDDAESDVERQSRPKKRNVECWLDGTE